MTRFPVTPRFIFDPNRFGGLGYTVLGLAGKITHWPVAAGGVVTEALLQVYIYGMPGDVTAPEAERLPLDDCPALLDPVKAIPVAVARMITSASAATQQQGITMLATASGYVIEPTPTPA